jgi:hypothetical protein
VLGAQVRWVLISAHLEELKGAVSEMILNPQLAHCQVADSPNAAPPADAYRGAGVGMDRQGQRHPEVCGQGLSAQAFGNSLHDAPKLGLPRR